MVAEEKNAASGNREGTSHLWFWANSSAWSIEDWAPAPYIASAKAYWRKAAAR